MTTLVSQIYIKHNKLKLSRLAYAQYPLGGLFNLATPSCLLSRALNASSNHNSSTQIDWHSHVTDSDLLCKNELQMADKTASRLSLKDLSELIAKARKYNVKIANYENLACVAKDVSTTYGAKRSSKKRSNFSVDSSLFKYYYAFTLNHNEGYFRNYIQDLMFELSEIDHKTLPPSALVQALWALFSIDRLNVDIPRESYYKILAAIIEKSIPPTHITNQDLEDILSPFRILAPHLKCDAKLCIALSKYLSPSVSSQCIELTDYGMAMLAYTIRSLSYNSSELLLVLLKVLHDNRLNAYSLSTVSLLCRACKKIFQKDLEGKEKMLGSVLSIMKHISDYRCNLCDKFIEDLVSVVQYLSGVSDLESELLTQIGNALTQSLASHNASYKLSIKSFVIVCSSLRSLLYHESNRSNLKFLRTILVFLMQYKPEHNEPEFLRFNQLAQLFLGLQNVSGHSFEEKAFLELIGNFLHSHVVKGSINGADLASAVKSMRNLDTQTAEVHYLINNLSSILGRSRGFLADKFQLSGNELHAVLCPFLGKFSGDGSTVFPNSSIWRVYINGVVSCLEKVDFEGSKANHLTCSQISDIACAVRYLSCKTENMILLFSVITKYIRNSISLTTVSDKWEINDIIRTLTTLSNRGPYSKTEEKFVSAILEHVSKSLAVVVPKYQSSSLAYLAQGQKGVTDITGGNSEQLAFDTAIQQYSSILEYQSFSQRDEDVESYAVNGEDEVQSTLGSSLAYSEPHVINISIPNLSLSQSGNSSDLCTDSPSQSPGLSHPTTTELESNELNSRDAMNTQSEDLISEDIEVVLDSFSNMPPSLMYNQMFSLMVRILPFDLSTKRLQPSFKPTGDLVAQILIAQESFAAQYHNRSRIISNDNSNNDAVIASYREIVLAFVDRCLQHLIREKEILSGYALVDSFSGSNSFSKNEKYEKSILDQLVYCFQIHFDHQDATYITNLSLNFGQSMKILSLIATSNVLSDSEYQQLLSKVKNHFAINKYNQAAYSLEEFTTVYTSLTQLSGAIDDEKELLQLASSKYSYKDIGYVPLSDDSIFRIAYSFHQLPSIADPRNEACQNFLLTFAEHLESTVSQRTVKLTPIAISVICHGLIHMTCETEAQRIYIRSLASIISNSAMVNLNLQNRSNLFLSRVIFGIRGILGSNYDSIERGGFLMAITKVLELDKEIRPDVREFRLIAFLKICRGVYRMRGTSLEELSILSVLAPRMRPYRLYFPIDGELLVLVAFSVQYLAADSLVSSSFLEAVQARIHQTVEREGQKRDLSLSCSLLAKLAPAVKNFDLTKSAFSKLLMEITKSFISLPKNHESFQLLSGDELQAAASAYVFSPGEILLLVEGLSNMDGRLHAEQAYLRALSERFLLSAKLSKLGSHTESRTVYTSNEVIAMEQSIISLDRRVEEVKLLLEALATLIESAKIK